LGSTSPVYASGQEISWIKVKDNMLSKDGRPFKFIGANAVNLVFYDNWDLDVEKAISQAKVNNISVLRLYLDWGWSKNGDFDRIIDIASRNGIYLILVLTDCCCSSDYSDLSKYFAVHAPFCNVTNSKSRVAFKKRIKQILERKNTVNGRIYRDEPTILAWELANELEYQHFTSNEVRSWIKDISGFVKSLDKNHLVTVGIMTNSHDFDKDCPVYDMFKIDGIDFFSFHFYPEVRFSNSGEPVVEDNYGQRIKYRVKKFLALNKPVVMEEFGFSNSADMNRKCRAQKTTSLTYNAVYQKSMDSAFLAGASGVMFWGWGLDEEKGIPMWWSGESHSIADKEFCNLIREYKIPYNIPGKKE
jgi:mannan endo-1,4-beta-mannosidase